MAVNPKLVIAAAKAAKKVITDEKARSKVIWIILTPVLVVLLILTMFVYMLTHPLEFLSTLFTAGELTEVENLQSEFGMYQSILEGDDDYTESYGKSYEGVTFADGETQVVYYNQMDSRWADMPYGTDNIGGYGCGPTSMAIVVSSLTSTVIDPIQMAEWAYKNGYWCSGSGSYHTLIPSAAKAFDLKAEGCSFSDGQKIVDALTAGKLVVALMSKGHFTKSGHFMVLRGVTSEGKILIADPGSNNRSNQEWDLTIILNEGSKKASAGGPFWIISK